MANSFTQAYIHYIFAVKGRRNFLIPNHNDELQKYIMNQQEHHKKRTFRDEYIEFLNKFEIEYDEKYLFEFYD